MTELQIILGDPLPFPSPSTLLLVSVNAISIHKHLWQTWNSMYDGFTSWLAFNKTIENNSRVEGYDGSVLSSWSMTLFPQFIF